MPGGRDGPRAGRHGARARRAAGVGRRARRSSSCPGRRASCSRCGRRRSRPRRSARRSRARPSYRQRDAAAVRHPGVGDRRDAARWPRTPARPRRRWRSRPACAAARSRSSRATSRRPQAAYDALRGDRARAPRRHAVLRRRRARSTSRWPTLLRARGWTIATAESCTGGLLAGAADRAAPAPRTTCSAALVVYSNEAKAALAGVDPALIERVGAVSVEVAEALADGARARAGRRRRGGHHRRRRARAAGREDKPVGLVCFSRRRAGRRAADARGAACPAAAPTCATARPPSPCTSSAGSCSTGDGGRAEPAMSARLFAALELPGRRARRAGGLRARGGRAATARCGPSREDALHLTLAFLGHRAPRRGRPRARGRARRRPARRRRC